MTPRDRAGAAEVGRMLWRCLFEAPAVAFGRALRSRRLPALPSVSQEEIERGAIACLIGVVVIAIMIGL